MLGKILVLLVISNISLVKCANFLYDPTAVSEFGACGSSILGERKCASGLVCVKKSEYFSQCLKEGSTNDYLSNLNLNLPNLNLPNLNIPNTYYDPKVSNEYGVCGNTFLGEVKCSEGLSCVKLNEYFSQCLSPSSAQFLNNLLSKISFSLFNKPSQ